MLSHRPLIIFACQHYLTASVAPAKVGFLHPAVRQQLRASAGHGDGSGFQHVGKVRDLQRHIGVLLHQQHRNALPVDFLNDFENILHHQRRKAQGRFIPSPSGAAGDGFMNIPDGIDEELPFN